MGSTLVNALLSPDPSYLVMGSWTSRPRTITSARLGHDDTFVDPIGGGSSPATVIKLSPFHQHHHNPSASTPIHPEVSSLPPLQPILLFHRQRGRTRISPIRPLRPADSQQILPPPQLPSIPQPAMMMEEGLCLITVDGWVYYCLFWLFPCQKEVRF